MRLLFLLIAILMLPLETFAEDILVVVNKENATDNLSKSQVIDIFMGRYVAFPDDSPAKPLDVSDSKLKGEFYKRLTKLNLAKVNAYWSKITFSGKARRPDELSDEAQVIDKLAKEPLSISYISASSLQDHLKVVHVITE